MYVNILGQATVYILKYMYKCQLIADFDKYLFINIYQQISKFRNIRGWSGGAMVLNNFKCRGVLLIWLIVGQGPTALPVGAGGGCLDIFTLIYLFSPLSPSLWETARYRLKYCLKGPLNPKQPTNQPQHQNIP